MNDKPVMLVVDDNEFSRAVLRAIFENEYSVIEADSGEKCLEILDSKKVNIILLDIIMPGMDGFEVLKRIKSDISLAAIPVIANTVGDSEDAESRALELGAADYITKPYRADVVRKRINNIVRSSDIDRLRIMAETDMLTGIYNRSAFVRHTKELITENVDTQYVLLCWNIERFKIINDLFGADMGDAALRDIASMLKSNVGNSGVCGRLEADNFACCFPYNEIDIDKIIAETKRRLPSNSIIYDVNVGVGIYVIDDVSIPVSTMCDRASIARNTIKGNYLRRYAFYDDAIREKMLMEQEIFAEMETALAERQFCVYYQPQYSSELGRPVAAEALVRWKHPEHGMISPGVFIPQFEKNGFITKLDYFVWEEACKFIQNQQRENKTVLPVSINISRINFYDDDLCDKIINLAAKYDVKPDLLHLEITESAYNENTEQLMGVMRRLQKAGFLVAMDDFGSGYSSLNMLKDLPLNILKIDMKFVSDIEQNDRAGSVLTSVVRMAKWLEMRVVAEGVETREQRDFLRSIGCDIIQGYYYSRPLPQADYKALIDSTKAVTLSRDVQPEDIACFMKANSDTDTMFNSVAGAAGVYELFSNSLEIQRVNNDYYKLTGSNPQTLMRDTKNGLAWIEAQDRQKVLDGCAEAEKTGETQRLAVRRYHKNGALMMLEMKIKFLGKRQNYSMYYIAMDLMPDSVALSCPVALPAVAVAVNNDKKEAEERHTILIVDDNKINRVMLKKMLSTEYDVLEAENGRNALELLRQSEYKISAILLDLVMPIMNGFEFLTVRSGNAQMSAIPVIVLTQGEEPDSELRALKLGATDFLKKPYEADRIIGRLKNDIEISAYTSRRISVQSVINNLPCGVLVYYCDGEEISGMYVNAVLCTSLGVSPEEGTKQFSQHGLDMVDEADRAQFKHCLLAAAASRKSINTEFRISRSIAKEEVWVRFRANFSHMEDTHVVYYAFLANITKEVKAIGELEARGSELENVNMKLNIAFAQASLYMWEHDLLTDKISMSATMKKKLGCKMNGMSFAALCEAGHMSKANLDGIIEPAMHRIKNGETPVSVIIPFMDKKGSEHWLRIKYILHIAGDDKPRRAIAVARDITDETVAQRRYEDAVGFRKTLIRDMLAFIEYDFTTCTPLSVYPAKLNSELCGRDIVRDVLIGDISRYADKETVELFNSPDKLTKSIKNGRTDDSFEFPMKSDFGTWQGEKWVLLSFNYRISNETGHAVAFISVRDISERKEREIALRHQARRDPLTGLKNRTSFTEHALAQLKSTLENGTLAAYYIIDIDNFKSLNDTKGHSFGDSVLRTLAQKLCGVFRTGDTIARLGGDELAVFIDNIPSVEFAEKRGNEICAALKNTQIGDGTMQISCSVGVAIAPRDGDELEVLYRHADHALYCVKRSGKGRCGVYSATAAQNGENNTF